MERQWKWQRREQKKAAVQKAAEQAGAYVKSYTKVKNLALESDFIEVIANHSMKIEVIEKKKNSSRGCRCNKVLCKN